MKQCMESFISKSFLIFLQTELVDNKAKNCFCVMAAVSKTNT